MPTVNPKTQIGDEVRPMTNDEVAQWETDNAELNAIRAAANAKEAARTSALAKLADLGLTAEEIAAL
jgi:hypothetical protein